MINLSVAIMSIPVRDASSILAKLDKSCPTEVVEDRYPHHHSVWDTCTRCLQRGIRSEGFHLILQDDVGLCQDFIPGVRAALGNMPIPNRPVTFFAARKCVTEAQMRGDSWVVIADAMWGQAMCYPVGLIGHYLAWDRYFINQDTFKEAWDDARFKLFCLINEIPIFATVPSLVCHTGARSSTIGHYAPGPFAAWYIGDDESALQIDWRGGEYRVTHKSRPETVISKYAKYLLPHTKTHWRIWKDNYLGDVWGYEDR